MTKSKCTMDIEILNIFAEESKKSSGNGIDRNKKSSNVVEAIDNNIKVFKRLKNR